MHGTNAFEDDGWNFDAIDKGVFAAAVAITRHGSQQFLGPPDGQQPSCSTKDPVPSDPRAADPGQNTLIANKKKKTPGVQRSLRSQRDYRDISKATAASILLQSQAAASSIGWSFSSSNMSKPT